MSSITKKIVAIVTTLTVSGWLVGPGVAQAVTIDELLAQIALLQAQLLQLQSGSQTTTGTGAPAACAGITFSRSLKQTMSGNDVKCMQALLNQDAATQVAASGVGSTGNETTYFGGLTTAAVKKFQEKYAADVLTPIGLTAGTGFVGAKSVAKLNALLAAAPTTPTTPPTTPTTPTAGENKVSLAADTPTARSLAKGAQNVTFAKVNFCAASEANTISKIVLSRGGVAADADLSAVKLYDGTVQVGSTQAILTTTHQATFPSLNWVIPANSCKALTVKANIAATATAGDTPKLTINSASDITSTVALDGVFPIESNSMTVAGISTGWLLVATTTPSGSIVAGGTEQGVAGFRFTASSTEGVKITSIKFTEVGSSVDTDVSNVKLFYGATQLGSTIASLTNGAAVIDLSASPLELLAGTSKDLVIYVDVGMSTGINNRTVQFEITDKTNLEAYGTNSGGTVVSYGVDSTNDTWPQKAASITINLGSLTVTQDTTYAPSAQSYSRGTSGNTINAFRFTAGANEGVRITYIKLKSATGTALTDSSVSNVGLYDTNGNLVAGPVGMVSGFVTFGSYTTGVFDTTGILDITKSSFKTLVVKADIPAGAATATDFLGFTINNPTTDVKADGLASQNDIPTGSINGNVSTAVPSTALRHDIIEKGTVTVSASPNTPSAANYAVGTTNFTLAKFDLTSTGEDIKVSQFNVFFATTSGATTTAADAADINNIRLYDGATLLATDANISSGYSESAIDLTVAKNTTKTITVVADIPTGSDAAVLQAWLQLPSNITASGISSGVTITATAATWASIKGNAMTKGVPTVTVRAATVPAAQTYIVNSSGILVTTLYLTATPTEDLKITTIQIAGGATSTATSSSEAATTTFRSAADGKVGAGFLGASLGVRDYVSNIKLFDGSTQVGNTVPTMTNGSQYDYADFTGLNLSIPKGVTKAIDVKLDINRSTTTTANTGVCFYFGVATTTASTVGVSGTGVQSGTAATISMGVGGTGGKCAQFGSSGTLVVQNDAAMPVSAIQIASETGKDVGKWKFTASNEAIKVSKLRFDVYHSANASATSALGSTATATTWGALATSTATEKKYAFNYSLNGGATSTCSFVWYFASTTELTVANFVALFNNTASSSCANDILAATTSATQISLQASSSASRSLMITDYPNPYGSGNNASNAAYLLNAGAKYGGAEAIGKTAGTDSNVTRVTLNTGSTVRATSYVGTDVAGRLIFNFSSGSELELAKGNTVVTLKADFPDYTAATEGSTFKLVIGTSTLTSASDTDYITAVGVSSGSTIGAGSITLDAERASNDQWIYATKPVVSLNASSPSGTQPVGTAKEIMRFDVNNPNPLIDLTINAIRFTVGTNATSAAFDRAYNLYNVTDLVTSVGAANSWASGTTTAASGFVTIYPSSGNTVSAGSTVTYVLYGDTSAMNRTTGADTLTLSIEDGDFFWTDGQAAAGNANQRVLNLPVRGNTMSY